MVWVIAFRAFTLVLLLLVIVSSFYDMQFMIDHSLNISPSQISAFRGQEGEEIEFGNRADRRSVNLEQLTDLSLLGNGHPSKPELLGPILDVSLLTYDVNSNVDVSFVSEELMIEGTLQSEHEESDYGEDISEDTREQDYSELDYKMDIYSNLLLDENHTLQNVNFSMENKSLCNIDGMVTLQRVGYSSVGIQWPRPAQI